MNNKYILSGKPSYDEREVKAITKVINSGWVGYGKKCKEFETRISKLISNSQIEYLKTVSLNSCSSAIHLSLVANDIGINDEVIIPSITWCSTVNSILHIGAKPVFCDIDPNTYCISEKDILSKITKNTKAVIITHYAGFALDVHGLRLKLDKNIIIIEDAAHALTSKYKNGNFVGSSGNLCCFSFHANKNFSIGEGGAITTTQINLLKKIKILSNNGLNKFSWERNSNFKSSPEGIPIEIGFKMNLNDLAASIGIEQLKKYKKFSKNRTQTVNNYINLLRNSKFKSDFSFQKNIIHEFHSKHLFVVKFPFSRLKISKLNLVKLLRSKKIGAGIHYSPLHKNILFRMNEFISLPHTDDFERDVFSLPINNDMTKSQVEKVCHYLIRLLDKNIK